MNKYTHLAGRILLAVIFILSGLSKIKDPTGTVGYMQSAGVPAILLWPTIALEVLGGLALVLGFQTRLVAAALAVFTVIAAAMFHNDFSDPNQMVNFLKNLSITGGLLLLVASGATAFSVDTRRR